MNSISVRLTFTDDDLYDNFIEPRKLNGDLPTLVLRLLTAYATNDDLAYQIDQFIDQDSNPDVCAAREAIMRAVARINGVDAAVSQEIEALDDGISPEDAEFDLVTGDEPVSDVVELPKEWVNDAPKPRVTSVSSVQPEQASNQNQSGTVPSTPYTAGQSDNVVLQSINALTSQVSALTSVVTQLVQGGFVPTAQVMPVKNLVENSVENVEVASQSPSESIENSVESVENSVEPVENLIEPVENSVESVKNSPAVAEADSTLTNESDSSLNDDYAIPDFMDAMLAGLG